MDEPIALLSLYLSSLKMKTLGTQTEFSSTMEGLQGQGSWVLRFLISWRKMFDRGGLASSPSHTSVLFALTASQALEYLFPSW